MPEARVRLYRIHYTLYIYVLCVCECVLSFVSFSPDHFNPCVGGHCFCSSLPHSLSCSPALSLSLFRFSAVFYLLYFSLRPCVLRFVSLSLCVFLSACSYLSHCMSLSRSLAPRLVASLSRLATVGDRLSGASASFTWVVHTVFIQGVFIMCT